MEFLIGGLILAAAALLGWMLGEAIGEQRGYDDGYVDATLAAVAFEREEGPCCTTRARTRHLSHMGGRR